MTIRDTATNVASMLSIIIIIITTSFTTPTYAHAAIGPGMTITYMYCYVTLRYGRSAQRSHICVQSKIDYRVSRLSRSCFSPLPDRVFLFQSIMFNTRSTSQSIPKTHVLRAKNITLKEEQKDAAALKYNAQMVRAEIAAENLGWMGGLQRGTACMQKR
ncbi:uncharacterized protein CC84DRAFT_579975 [Paraphaeosphaeria sporulosa]|uniref:Uncharacterized protein n=1 Tax=Paraphaeosphaeria sporulosa TaxID=1460663 RepID=A0A177CLP8_9PLEO|nr:uncharacterized protein CC84DRAFT_579975 [Paraphaeosphaeria sporulosa]OAG08474.1 hypothetical protein CC84DRAFT_579975 [Paraphaeosphaeria sporulosa]